MIRPATIATILVATLASGSAAATKTAGEAIAETFEEIAEQEHRHVWCRIRWIREQKLGRILAGLALKPCPPPSEAEMQRWRTERDNRRKETNE